MEKVLTLSLKKKKEEEEKETKDLKCQVTLTKSAF